MLQYTLRQIEAFIHTRDNVVGHHMSGNSHSSGYSYSNENRLGLSMHMSPPQLQEQSSDPRRNPGCLRL
jgi:hypothetical protein